MVDQEKMVGAEVAKLLSYLRFDSGIMILELDLKSYLSDSSMQLLFIWKGTAISIVISL